MMGGSPREWGFPGSGTTGMCVHGEDAGSMPATRRAGVRGAEPSCSTGGLSGPGGAQELHTGASCLSRILSVLQYSQCTSGKGRAPALEVPLS